ncbi:helix-turn-helix domain-containing protein [Gracilinema caldarium]|uniref:helix-turn-helix domain-containing protein n=1 Tax=Gracilinema caldarium TaxID=215591 RepID=UPI0026F36C70|nr:helix-turn-helix domain-containing protein [Gracilinema caldarium]
MKGVVLTVREAAAILGLHPKNVYYLLYMGYIEGWKIAHTWRISIISVEAYDQRTVKKSA